jgi:hypothetical protein
MASTILKAVATCARIPASGLIGVANFTLGNACLFRLFARFLDRTVI